VSGALNDWKSNTRSRASGEGCFRLDRRRRKHWLGWLSIVDEQIANIDAFKTGLAPKSKSASSNTRFCWHGWLEPCPEVLRMDVWKNCGFPEMHVLDSTDPAQIKAIEKKLDLKKTLCIVSSKSGSNARAEYLQAISSSA